MQTESGINWETSYEQAVARVRDGRKHLLVFYHKPNCSGCLRMEADSFPQPDVAAYSREHWVAFSASLADKESRPLFRDNHVIWTPSIGCGDRKGRLHYISPGYLPGADLLAALRIGRARCLMAWTRHAEAATELEEAAGAGGAMAAEALFWLGTAQYFRQQGSEQMYQTFTRLRELYPDSPWARRAYPGG